MEQNTDQPNEPMPMQHTEPDMSPVQPPYFAKKAVHRKKVVGLTIGLSLLGLLVVGGAAYWYFMVRDTTPKAATTAPPTPPPAEKPVVSDATPETYKSSKLNVEFTHRKDWTVREYAERSEVIVTSPKTTYTKADGSSAEGVFTLRMRTGTIPDAMQNTVIKSIAVRDSEVVAYDAPTEQQRQYTNITDAGSDANTFTFVIVSSSTAFKAGQVLGYGVNLTGDAYLFVGGYGTDSNNSLAFDPVSKANFATPTYDQAVAVIKSLKIY